MPVGLELLQIGLANVKPLLQAVLPRRVAYNPTLGNLAVIRNPNLEDSHIVHLQPFPQIAADGCLQIHSKVVILGV
jgi:hypothetical protein